MVSISKKQIADRWDTLPDELLDALVSEENSDYVWELAAEQHISEEDTRTVAMIVSRVLMGFIRPEDVAQELRNSLTLDQRAAALMQDLLTQRIFAPLRQSINRVYVPIAGPTLGPKILTDIDQPRPIITATATPAPILRQTFSAQAPTAPVATPMPALTVKPGAIISASASAAPLSSVTTPMPKPMNAASARDSAENSTAPKTPAPMFSATAGAGGGSSIGSTSSVNNKNLAAATPAPKPKQTSDIGWSTKQQTQTPVVRLGVITPSIPTPMQGSTSAPLVSPASSATTAQQLQSNGQKTKIMSEFERLDLMSKPSVKTPISIPQIPTPAPTTPPPVMLHQDNPLQSIQSSSTSRFSVGVASHDQFTASTPVKTAAPRPAVIEFGKTNAAGAPAAQPAPTNVVHYSQYTSGKPPLPPTASDGPRQRVEITTPATPRSDTTNTTFVPMPPAPPKPPTPPTNPQPPQQDGKPKVIVQNYR
jgi:hypothetical protein